VQPLAPCGAFRSAIFDFDFTLADSSSGIFDCVSTALVAMGIAPASREDVNATIGLDLHETFARLAGSRDAIRIDEFVERFYRRADQVMVNSTVLFEFVPDALRQIRRQGIAMAVASTKRRAHIEAILKRENLDHMFGAVVGGNDVENQKPHPESLLVSARRLRVSHCDCVYVGDSIVDAEAARRAGIRFVAVLTGVTHRSEFDSFPVSEILNNIGELPAWLEASSH